VNSLISVIIPMRDGEDYIGEAVESVRGQNMRVEIVAVDDGSADASPAIAAGLGCKVVSIPHAGIAAACNAGVRHAAGDFLFFLDQDDVVRPGGLRRLHEALAADRDAHAAAGMALDFVSPELSEEDRGGLVPRKAPYHGLLTGSRLLRRSVVDMVGLFDEECLAGQAVDFLLRMDSGGLKTVRLDVVTAMRRLHRKNTGITMKDKQFRDYGNILRKRLKRGAGNG
jgi:glycosyltransferase involved in cell wall biosynthesis